MKTVYYPIIPTGIPPHIGRCQSSATWPPTWVASLVYYLHCGWHL